MQRKWWTLLTTCVAMFMLLLDVTIVNIALPYIQKDLARASAIFKGRAGRPFD